MRLTEAQARQFIECGNGKPATTEACPVAVAVDYDPNAGMNGLERRYAEQLEQERAAGAIREWRYEAIRLVLGRGAAYTCDFLVVTAAGEIELRETKGFMREAARVRLLTAARLFPWFRFRLVRERAKRDGGGWEITEVGG